MSLNSIAFVGADFSAEGFISSSSLLLLIDTAIKSFLLLTITMIAARTMRNRSAATIHRMWTLGFTTCLILPVVTLVAPSWNLPILPRFLIGSEAIPIEIVASSNENANGVEYQQTQSDPSLLLNEGSFSKTPVMSTAPNSSTPLAKSQAEGTSQPDAEASEVVPAVRSTAALSDAKSKFSWVALLITIWVGGACALLLRTGWHSFSLIRLLRKCTTVASREWKTAVADASRSLGLRRKVELLKLDEARSPMVAGILRTVVVLPGDADRWDLERCRLVLLHELAHAKRHDVLTQTIAMIVCAMHWFNPVGWYGLFQMRKLRELACDDLVIASGQQPADYADVLLDVAKSYRHRNLSMAVGMARSSNVENRIMAVLDKARSHMAISRTAARTLFASALAIVVCIGSMRLQSQAENTPSKSDSKDETVVELAEKEEFDSFSDDTKFRTMMVRITDEDDRPIPAAELHVGLWYTKNYEGERIPRDYVADNGGVIKLRLPHRLRILRLWPSKSGFVPEFVNFSQGSHDEGKKIPDHYEFQLAKGTELSGTVVDEEGNPISGVTVDVKVKVDEPAWGTNPHPMISTWLTDEDFNEPSAITDQDGKWKINNAPAKTTGKDYFKFFLKFNHTNYRSDASWGELQKEQEITTAMLRVGTAKLELSRGTALTGSIVDSSGNPVTNGLVIWDNDPYHATGVKEARIDSDGSFKTLPLPPGEYPITIIAPGFHPERQIETVSKSMEEVKFTLKPGKRLILKVVDTDAIAIPNARVSLRKWREVDSLYNHIHSNVPDSGIPGDADENGIYVWDWAPSDAVTYQVSADGFSSTTVTLIATEDEHIVELHRQLIASGKVTDAKTGEPVQAFRVLPIHVNRPDWLTTWFLGAVTGEKGQYEIRLDGASDTRQYKVRVEAEGYRSTISERTFDLSEGHVTQDISLEPSLARVGMVVDAAGATVKSASVVQATPSIVPNMEDSELEGGWSGRRSHTSEAGKFQLAATSEPVRIRVTHQIGFAEVLRQPNEAIGTIQLRPWSKISGRLLQDGNPVAEQNIYFRPARKGQLGEPRFQDSYRAQTDADGKFEFERLPPIMGSLSASLGPWRDSPLTSSRSQALDLKPGESQTVELGGSGIAVTGKVVTTGRDNVSHNKNWSLNYLIRRDQGLELPEGFPKLSFDLSGNVQASWFLDPNGYQWLNTRQHYFVKLKPDGQLRISGVPAGIYDLVLRLYEQPAGCLVETIGEKVVTVEVTESEVSTGTKDIGEIEVECRAGPRVGENMQLYSFTDTMSRQRTIKELEGRYVLMHVWASWCAPCLATMPDIKATKDRLADQPITFVGLNLDKDISRAQTLAQQNSLNWSQNYLGDDSDMARQLAISSVPTYFLIGPDGLLTASATEWSEIKTKLESLDSNTSN